MKLEQKRRLFRKIQKLENLFTNINLNLLIIHPKNIEVLALMGEILLIKLFQMQTLSFL